MDKPSKAHKRQLIFILGIFMLGVLLLIPFSVSYAEGIVNQRTSQGFTDANSADTLRHTLLLTDTVTATPTINQTFTQTPTSTPTVTASPTETTTPTSTDTSTSTPAGTVSATGTSTSTSTSTPTVTGTQPTTTATPTVTGTLSVVPSLKVSVQPTQAKVNENFTFAIEVGNIGTGVTTNNVVLDAFPTYIDVLTVTTGRGTITKLAHSFVVTIGDIAPNEKIIIVAGVKVNATLTRTETVANVVTLTYDISKSMTASVNYKVIYQTLPPTGELPLNWRERGMYSTNMLPGVILLVIGSILLLIGIWSKVTDKKNTLWMITAGSLFVIVGFIIGMSASGILTSARHSNQNENYPTESGILAQAQPEEPSVTNLPRLPASAFSTPEAVPIVTLPNYPIPTPVVTITPKPGESGPDTSPVVRIAIPGILLDTEVKYVPYDGVSWMISGLREEVAWMGNTSWPGLGGNTGLAGHVTVAGLGDGPFRHLDELTAGEVVILYTENNAYTYTVRESRITDDGDMSVTLATDNPQITLITCVNWDQESHTYLNRLIVFADLVRTEPITMGKAP
jgi:LPXTG-site transpeptidase (sortase) family protein